jgi:hypothetical protein
MEKGDGMAKKIAVWLLVTFFIIRGYSVEIDIESNTSCPEKTDSLKAAETDDLTALEIISDSVNTINHQEETDSLTEAESTQPEMLRNASLNGAMYSSIIFLGSAIFFYMISSENGMPPLDYSSGGVFNEPDKFILLKCFVLPSIITAISSVIYWGYTDSHFTEKMRENFEIEEYEAQKSNYIKQAMLGYLFGILPGAVTALLLSFPIVVIVTLSEAVRQGCAPAIINLRPFINKKNLKKEKIDIW